MTEGLGDFFKLIAEDKKRKKDELRELVGEIDYDSIFSEVKEEIAKDKVNSVKAEKQVKAFESWLLSETEEEKEEIVAEVAEVFREEVQQEDVALTREERIAEEVEEETVISKSIKVLDTIVEQEDPLNDTQFATFDDLKKHYQLFLDRISVQLGSLGGGGIEDAPKTGGPYARRNQAWEVISSGGGTGIGSTSILYDGSTVRVEATDYGALTTGISSATNVSIANTFTYPEYITGGMVPKAIKSQGGYDRTSAFDEYQTGTEASQDPADYIEYTQELATSGTWKRFGITTAGNQARDGNWWGETNPNYDQDKGLFGGLTAPAGVDHFFDFSENTAFNNAQTTGSLKYTQALGSFSLKECQVGDLVLARFDLNIMPMVTNTTVEVALIYANRDANDNVTFTFPLTITPFTYGNGTVGRGYLLRPTITAYMANQQDVNSRSLLAIKADNPILVNPIGVLFTIQR